MIAQTEMCRTCLVVISIFVSFVSNSQNLPDKQVTYYFHKEGTLSFKEISDPKREAEFIALDNNAVAYGVNKTAIWVRFKISEPSAVQKFAELTCANFGWVSYYYQSTTDGLKEYHSGFALDFHSRPILVERFVFPLSEGTDWHYLNIKTNHSINTQVLIKTQEEVVSDAGTRSLLYLAYMGIILAMIAGVAFYIYLIKYYSYLFYIGYMVSINMITLLEKGYYFQIFWPHNPFFNIFAYLLPYGISGFMLLFLRGIWTKDTFVKALFHINFWIVTVLPFSISMYYFYNHHFDVSGEITQYHLTISGILTIVTSIVSFSRAENSLKLPLILINFGLCILCTALLIYLATLHNIFPVNFFTDNILLLGSTLEIIFLTTALVIRSDEIYKTQKARLSLNRDF